MRPRLDSALYLKLGEERAAFPYIERVATTHPAHAKELAEEFLRVWIKNHNPNESQGRTNPYMFMYGFEERSNGIPLTRSKQERNLVELAEWIGKLKALPLESLDETLVAKAFTTAHSSAEVYRIETIERVFGARRARPDAGRAGADHARTWPACGASPTQETRRRAAAEGHQAEVVRGYEVARQVVDRALADHPDDWSLHQRARCVLRRERLPARADKKSDFAPAVPPPSRFHRAAALRGGGRARRAEQTTRSTSCGSTPP